MPAEHIGIDANPSAISRNFPHSLGIVGDAKEIFGGCSNPPPDAPEPKLSYREELSSLHRALRKQVRNTMGPWENILDGIQEFMPDDAILVRDVTVPATTWGSRLIVRRYPRTTLHASGGGIGQGLPMAIGAQIAAPSKTVVALCGDGGLLVNIGELAAARQENAPIVIVLFDDHGYGVLRNIQKAHFEGRTIGSGFRQPGSCECRPGLRLRIRAGDFRSGIPRGLRRAVTSRVPSMIVVDSDAIGPMKEIFAGPDGGAALYRPH